MSFDDCYFLIPARKGSKGFPGKNVALFDYTAKTIPIEFLEKVFVSTDDELIKDKSLSFGFNVVDRPVEYARDESSLKEVLEHFIQVEDIAGDAKIILLYLTYPERTWDDILRIYNWYKKYDCKSLLCGVDVVQHPYLCMIESENSTGFPLISHELYRRQDYPRCFCMSCFVVIFKVSEFFSLTDLLYNSDTKFYNLQTEKLDVDYEEDYLEWKIK
jgi:CMP-N-acetylneuraminic acid synthetase